MKKDKVIKLLSILKAKNVLPLESWVKCSCLFAKHTHKSGKDNNPSSGISFDTNLNMYNCYSCGTKMPISDALFELFRLNRQADIVDPNVITAMTFLDDMESEDYLHEDTPFEEDAYKKEFYDFGEGWLNGFSSVFNFPKAMDYLKNRKGGAVPDRVIKELDLRYDQPKQLIGFPYREWDHNKVAGMRGRSIDPIINSDDTKKNDRHRDYKYPDKNNTSLVWYRANALDPSKPLVVVEGEFDSARVYQLYRNVTALLTANASPQKMLQLCQFTEGVYWFTDSDDPGQKSRVRAREFFEKNGVNFEDMIPPEGFKDPGEMPIKFLKYVLKEHLTLDETID